MKTKFLLVIMIYTILLFFPQINYAANSNYGSVLYSDNMGGFSTEQNTAMVKAKNTYEELGYSTSKVLEPSELTLRSNLLSSHLILFYSHGDLDSITFDNTGLITGPARLHGNNSIYHISTNDFNWNPKKLVIFCACNTAGNGSPDSNSISSKVVSSGAQTSIGWYNTINSISSPDWLNNFHEKLLEGYNPLEAVNYANDNLYLLPSVRNTLVSYRSLSSLNTYSYEQNNNDKKNILENLSIQKSDLKSTDINIEKIIKQYDSEFNSNNYIKTESNGIYLYNFEDNSISKYTSYIDYNYTIGNYILNSGYTIVLDKNNNIIKIIDNTIDFDYKKIYENISNNISYNINNKYYYDLNTNKQYIIQENNEIK